MANSTCSFEADTRMVLAPWWAYPIGQHWAFPLPAGVIASNEQLCRGHLRGIDPIVTLRWPGTAKQKFQVQIYAGRAEVFSQEVTGNVLKVPLRSGPRYRWQVSRKERGGFMQLVSPQSFQLSSELEFNFDGKKGESGREMEGETCTNTRAMLRTTPQPTSGSLCKKGRGIGFRADAAGVKMA